MKNINVYVTKTNASYLYERQSLSPDVIQNEEMSRWNERPQ